MNLKYFFKIIFITAAITSAAIGIFLLSTIKNVTLTDDSSATYNPRHYPEQLAQTNTNSGSGSTTDNQHKNENEYSPVPPTDTRITSTEDKDTKTSGTAPKTADGRDIPQDAPNIPFTPQAPLAEWNDPRQRDGCEEASALMAIRWARGEKLTPAEAKKEILPEILLSLP